MQLGEIILTLVTHLWASYVSVCVHVYVRMCVSVSRGQAFYLSLCQRRHSNILDEKTGVLGFFLSLLPQRPIRMSNAELQLDTQAEISTLNYDHRMTAQMTQMQKKKYLYSGLIFCVCLWPLT